MHCTVFDNDHSNTQGNDNPSTKFDDNKDKDMTNYEYINGNDNQNEYDMVIMMTIVTLQRTITTILLQQLR